MHYVVSRQSTISRQNDDAKKVLCTNYQPSLQ
jgi:hypothetical protein